MDIILSDAVEAHDRRIRDMMQSRLAEVEAKGDQLERSLGQIHDEASRLRGALMVFDGRIDPFKLTPVKRSKPRGPASGNAEKVLGFLGEYGPATTVQVAEALGLERQAAYNALRYQFAERGTVNRDHAVVNGESVRTWRLVED